MVEPEPYEIPPVSPRFRAGASGSEPGPPKSFEVPPTAVLVDDETLEPLAEAAPLPAGGPQFGAKVLAGPVDRPGAAPSRGSVPTPFSRAARSGWKPPRPGRKRRARPMLARVLVVVVLGAGAYLAYPHVRTLIAAHFVPADLRGYVEGRGVSYAPAGQGYAVRLPSSPVARDAPVVVSGGEPPALMHRSIVAGAHFSIVIRVADLPAANALPNGPLGALHDAQLAGSAPSHVRAVTFLGQTALDYDLPGNPATHARMFVRGLHVYVISVQSSASVSTVFDTLTGSFKLTG